MAHIIEEPKEKISLDTTTHKNKPIVIDFIHLLALCSVDIPYYNLSNL